MVPEIPEERIIALELAATLENYGNVGILLENAEFIYKWMQGESAKSLSAHC